jgi:hypothetical protein
MSYPLVIRLVIAMTLMPDASYEPGTQHDLTISAAAVTGTDVPVEWYSSRAGQPGHGDRLPFGHVAVVEGQLPGRQVAADKCDLPGRHPTRRFAGQEERIAHGCDREALLTI